MPAETPFVMSSMEAQLLQVSLANLAEATKRNADAVVGINESLSVLTRLETQQSILMTKLQEDAERVQKLDDRLKALEIEMPGLREMRKWVIAGVLAVVGILGAALVKLVIVDVPRIPQYVVDQDTSAAVTVKPTRQGKEK